MAAAATGPRPASPRPPRILLAERGGPAPGRPLVVKDLLDTAGLETTYGSAIFAGHVPERSAEAVRRAERHGWTVTAKANLHEFAWGITSENPHFGWVPNPLDGSRTPGGSSGGSAAAIAAGLCEVALGTDSGGSIRIPAACCGVAGFKPSWGRVPADGCFPLAPSFDAIGPLGRTVGDCTELARALDPELTAIELGSLSELRIGLAWIDGCDPAVAAPLVALGETVGARPVGLDAGRPGTPVFMRECAGSHAGLWPERRSQYGENVDSKLELASRVSDAELAAGEDERRRYRERFAALFEGPDPIDLLLTPTLGCVAPAAGVGDLELRALLLERTYPANAVGAPALAIPCAAAEGRLPASAQLIGRPGDDALVLAAGLLLERAIAAEQAR